MNPDEQRDLSELLVGVYEQMKRHEEALNQLQITAGALVATLREGLPLFPPAYTKHFEGLKAGPLGQALGVQLGLIDAVIQGLRNSESA